MSCLVVLIVSIVCVLVAFVLAGRVRFHDVD